MFCTVLLSVLSLRQEAHRLWHVVSVTLDWLRLHHSIFFSSLDDRRIRFNLPQIRLPWSHHLPRIGRRDIVVLEAFSARNSLGCLIDHTTILCMSCGCLGNWIRGYQDLLLLSSLLLLLLELVLLRHVVKADLYSSPSVPI